MNTYEYFGIPLSNRVSASEFASRQDSHIANIRVPTRTEVATLGTEELFCLIERWIYHSATEIIPSRLQVAQARDVLLTRADASTLKNLLQLCDDRIGKGKLPW